VIRLAVLDMAGTTVNDDGAVERAFAEAVSLGKAVSLGDAVSRGQVASAGDVDARALEYVRATMGQPKIVVFRALFEGDEDAAQAANRRFEQEFDAAVGRGEVRAIAGAEMALADLRAAGIQVCLTTGFSASTRDRIIDALGWRASIDLALSPADAGRGRPYPDMILSALLRLGVDDVHDVAVTGDTTSDLVAGTRAGAAVVAGVLTGAHTRAELERAPHTHIIDSVGDLPAILSV
jgi:phosphonatase-like hydrolase